MQRRRSDLFAPGKLPNPFFSFAYVVVLHLYVEMLLQYCIDIFDDVEVIDVR